MKECVKSNSILMEISRKMVDYISFPSEFDIVRIGKIKILYNQATLSSGGAYSRNGKLVFSPDLIREKGRGSTIITYRANYSDVDELANCLRLTDKLYIERIDLPGVLIIGKIERRFSPIQVKEDGKESGKVLVLPILSQSEAYISFYTAENEEPIFTSKYIFENWIPREFLNNDPSIKEMIKGFIKPKFII